MDGENLPVTPSGRAKLLVDRGLALYGRGDIARAVRYWLAARDADPDNRRAHEYLTFIREYEGVNPESVGPIPAEARLQPEPIGPPRSVLVPEYIPNPPAGAEEAAPLEVITEVTAMPHPMVPGSEMDALLAELRDKMDHNDFSGSIEVAEKMLERDPEHAEARGIYRIAQSNLIRHLEAKLGDLRAVPAIRIPADEVIWLNLNHREGFVLSQVDGLMRYEDILDVCGMPRLEALRILVSLVGDGVIAPIS
jgi:hypothetical protein